jgi:hypothetical protein
LDLIFFKYYIFSKSNLLGKNLPVWNQEVAKIVRNSGNRHIVLPIEHTQPNRSAGFAQYEKNVLLPLFKSCVRVASAKADPLKLREIAMEVGERFIRLNPVACYFLNSEISGVVSMQ